MCLLCEFCETLLKESVDEKGWRCVDYLSCEKCLKEMLQAISDEKILDALVCSRDSMYRTLAKAEWERRHATTESN